MGAVNQLQGQGMGVVTDLQGEGEGMMGEGMAAKDDIMKKVREKKPFKCLHSNSYKLY